MCDFFPPGIMSAHGLLSSVFSCSQGSKSAFKRRLRETRSLDPAMMMRPRGCEVDEPTQKGDFNWKRVHGSSVGLQPVPLQSLSELERVRLQEVAFCRLLDDHDLGCQISLPKDGQKRKKSLRRKLDSLSKERSKDKDHLPQAFGVPLAEVIANDRAFKQRQDAQEGRGNREVEESGEARDASSELVFSFLHGRSSSSSKRSARGELSSSNSSLSSSCETPTELLACPGRRDTAQRTHRRGGVSVDCITDLGDSQSRILEALQLALPAEAPGGGKKRRDKKLSLNPMYQQVPRVVDWCCQHLEKHGLQTEGIFRKGSINSRVKQLREEFDQGLDVPPDEAQNVHEVASLLKEFLRDLPHPLLTRELYSAFINSMFLDNSLPVLQLLIFLLPPCNSDTLQHLLHFLSTVASHADDRLAADGTEITGNKMPARNLATIFGPNLLHMQKNSDKEFEVQSLARAKDHMAVIAVVLSLITNYQTLFMVPCDLQNEVLTSILETDCDVVEPLLRRKDSQYSGSGLLRAPQDGDSDPGEARWSCGSHRDEDSSGDVSPYDNNSPALSGRGTGGGGGASPPSDADRCLTLTSPGDSGWAAPPTGEGSHGGVSDCGSGSSSEGLHRRPDNAPWSAVRRTQSAVDVAGRRPHPRLTGRSSGESLGRRPAMTPAHHRLLSQSGASSSEDVAAAATTDTPAGRRLTSPLKDSGSLRHGAVSGSAPSLSASDLTLESPPTSVTGGRAGAGPVAPEGRAERWSLKQLLCVASAAVDDLPESLV